MSMCDKCEECAWYYSNKVKLCRGHFTHMQITDRDSEIEKLQTANKILSECVLRIQKVMDVKTYNALDTRIQNHLNEAKQKAEEVMNGK